MLFLFLLVLFLGVFMMEELGLLVLEELGVLVLEGLVV
jgi:hypothetical protein